MTDTDAPGRPRVRRWMVVPALCALVGGTLLVGSLLREPRHYAVGDCVVVSGLAALVVGCDAPGPKYRVVEHNPDSTYLARCDMVDADAGLGISGPAVLCVDYVVRAGDCIAVKTADFVDCDSTAEVRKVLALLTGTVDPGGCPADTTDHLRYRSRGEVLCLGTPPR